MIFSSALQAMFAPSEHTKPLSPSDNLRLYLAETVLPLMISGSSAPPMPAEGHKSHLNHLAIKPEDYRSRFTKIVAPKSKGMFDNVVSSFFESFPKEMLDIATVDDRTGYAFTVPAPGFDITTPPSIPRPTNVHEVTPWVLTLPLQTAARALHAAFPDEGAKWDVTYVNRSDGDSGLWNTLVWRRTPPPSNIETFYMEKRDPLEECSVVVAVQPPWILTQQDFKAFLKCSSLPPFNAWDETENRPFTGAERVWGKLWDTCVRMGCHHWVLTTYWGWVFGAFSQGFTAGQILDMKTYDAQEPTVLQCLVYHVASSMGLAPGSKLPQYLETPEELEWNMDIPEPITHDADIDYPDSGSEWDGMDDEPEISAGISSAYDGYLSAWGSEIGPRPSTRVPWEGSQSGYRVAQLDMDRAMKLVEWEQDVKGVDPPSPRERSISPGAESSSSDTATAPSGGSIYWGAFRGGSVMPEGTVGVTGSGVGEVLNVVDEQGPEEKEREGVDV